MMHTNNSVEKSQNFNDKKTYVISDILTDSGWRERDIERHFHSCRDVSFNRRYLKVRLELLSVPAKRSTNISTIKHYQLTGAAAPQRHTAEWDSLAVKLDLHSMAGAGEDEERLGYSSTF